MSYSNWINCKDKLPAISGEYLVNIHYFDEQQQADIVLLAFFNNKVVGVPMFSSVYGWHLLNEFYDLSDKLRGNITHWMPLPTPPEDFD